MDRTTKILLITGPTFFSFIYAITSPSIHVYFINQIGPQVLAASNMITVGLAAVINSTIPNDRLKDLYRRNFYNIVIIDIISFYIVSFLGLEYAVVRFIGFSLMDAISTNLWIIILKNSINRVINGDKLTDWESFSKSFSLYASLIGGFIALISADKLNIESCIIAQCIATTVMGILDLKAFTRLNNIRK